MAAGSTDVVIRFLADSSKVTAEIDKVDKSGSKIKSWAKGVGLAIGAAFAVKAVHDFIDAGAQLQDQMAAADQIFGDLSKATKEWAKTTTDAFGISETAALKAANTFATFGKSAGLSGERLSTFSTDLTELAGDLSSFRGTSTEQAIEAIGSALRGESEPIRAYGILLDEATLKARALELGLLAPVADQAKIKSALLSVSNAQQNLNKTIAKFGPDSKEALEAQQKLEIAQAALGKATAGTVPELTAQQRVIAAEAEIYAQSTDAIGDFARTSDSAANQQKILSAKIEDVKTALGTALLPAVTMILPHLSTMAAFVERNAGWMVPLAAGIVGVVVAVKLWIGVQALLNGLLAMFGVQTTVLLGPLALVALAVIAVYAAVVLLYAKWDQVWSWIGNLPWYAKVGLAIVVLTNPVFLLIAAVTTLAVYWERVWGVIYSVARAVVGPIVDLFDPLISVLERVAAAAGKVKDALSSIGSKVGAGFGGGLFNIPGLASGGIVTRPTLALIGEAGPEAVIPLSRGGAGGPFSINVTVNTTGLGADAPQIQSAVVSAIQTYVGRNGPIPGIAG